MEKTTTPENRVALVLSDGRFARQCWKCGGTGIYWKAVSSFVSDITGVAEVCFPCEGTGWKGKTFESLEEFDVYVARLERARERREAARRAEQADRADRAQAAAEPAQPAIEWKHLDASIGDVVTVTGRVDFVSSFENSYGSTTRIISIETEANQVVKLFTSAQWAFDVKADDTIQVTGSVSRFDEYGGRPETLLKRPKIHS